MDFTPMKDVMSVVFGFGMVVFAAAVLLNWINKRF